MNLFSELVFRYHVFIKLQIIFENRSIRLGKPKRQKEISPMDLPEYTGVGKKQLQEKSMQKSVRVHRTGNPEQLAL